MITQTRIGRDESTSYDHEGFIFHSRNQSVGSRGFRLDEMILGDPMGIILIKSTQNSFQLFHAAQRVDADRAGFVEVFAQTA